MSDNINPSHYRKGDIECIEAIRAALTPEEFRGYCKGNAIKYVWREGMKGGNESLQKANWYMDKAVSVSTQPAPAQPAYPYLAEVGAQMAAKSALERAERERMEQAAKIHHEMFGMTDQGRRDDGLASPRIWPTGGMLPQEPADDGWIEWGGGECPVDETLLIDVKFKYGGTNSGVARSFDWHNRNLAAYRVTKWHKGDGWVRWEGGRIPVGGLEMVEVETRDGQRGVGRASDFLWNHFRMTIDIVAYRAVTA